MDHRRQLTYERDWAVDIAIFGTDLIFTRQLLLVALFIGMFSGLNAVQVIPMTPTASSSPT